MKSQLTRFSPQRSVNLRFSPESQELLRYLNWAECKTSELVSGVKLGKIVNMVFYEGENTILKEKIIVDNEQRKGNNVINMNIVLKQVKTNLKNACPQYIQELTTFKLTENEQEMVKFINWISQCWSLSNTNPNTKSNGKREYQDQSKRGTKLQNFLNESLEKQKNQQFGFEDNYHINEQKFQQQEEEKDAFENVYFCHQHFSPSKINHEINDSLELSDKISKKGSFKVLRPKSSFGTSENKSSQNEYSLNENPVSPAKNQGKANNQMRNRKMRIEESEHQQRYYSQQKQSSGRKTVPKMAQRPPIYRKMNKEQTKTQSQTKNIESSSKYPPPNPFQIDSQQGETLIVNKAKNQFSNLLNRADKQNRSINQQVYPEVSHKNSQIFESIQDIEEQIERETLGFENKTSSLHLTKQRSQSKTLAKSNRKLFKTDLPETSTDDKKLIIEWLISINLLNSMAITYFDRFHEICKNGVIFPQIISYHKGRSGDFCYFKNPIKSAQIHSNFQKVFAYLKEIPNFESQLIFKYEYFVPEAIQNAFWNLLSSCYKCFFKSNHSKNRAFGRESLIKERLKTKPESQLNSERRKEKVEPCSNSLKKSQKFSSTTKVSGGLGEGDYQKIKFGSTKKFKQNKKLFDIGDDTKIIDAPVKQLKTKRKSSLDFIKQLPDKHTKSKYEQLVQVDEPFESSKITTGYKDLYQLKRNHNSSFINTPQKHKQSTLNVSKSILVNHINTNSIKKLQQKPEQPSVTLQMQMKVLKYLKQKSFLPFDEMDSLPLFEDPIRNGVLINKIIIEEVKSAHKFNSKPRNIVDCRQNFKKAFMQLKQSFIILPSAFEYYFQDVIKGQLTLFYGIVYNILNTNPNRQIVNNGIKSQSTVLNSNQNHMEEALIDQILFWIRQLEQENMNISKMQIRNFYGLISAIVCQNLLYKIASIIMCQKYTIKPTYDAPVNQLQQESNLKKILSFYAHNKILKNEQVWKAKNIAKREKGAILQVMKQLMYYVKSIRKTGLNHQSSQVENSGISFVKFVRQNSRDQIKDSRNIQRMETTMANNSFSNPPHKESVQNNKKQSFFSVDIPWMRQLGFKDDLSLSNGVILCRLVSKFTMQTINFNENPSSKAECLMNLRRVLKVLGKIKWDEQQIASADEKTTMEIYQFLKEKFKYSYALKNII